MVALPVELLSKVLPFHLAFDKNDFLIKGFGLSVPKIAKGISVDKPIQEFFQLIRPKIDFQLEPIQKNLNLSFILKSTTNAVELKGQVYLLPDGDTFVFICTPIVKEVSQLQTMGITLNDFALHDPIAEFLFMMQAHKKAFEESKSLSDKLTIQNRELLEKKKELEETLNLLRQHQEEIIRRKIAEQEAQKAKEIAEKEMELARKIQTCLLPIDVKIPGYEFLGYMQTATAVGGDYYDAFVDPNGKNWLAIGDVSGHGVSSGLIMMMVQTAIRASVYMNPNVGPKEQLETVNRIISSNIKQLDKSKYMTLTLFHEHKPGEFFFSGLHQDIYIFRYETQKIHSIETSGSWLGLYDLTNIFEIAQLELNPGDMMFLFTDGLTEAKLENGDLLDNHGLQKIVSDYASKPNLELKNKILECIAKYELLDDVTFVILRRET